jgi:hypothetical protein
MPTKKRDEKAELIGKISKALGVSAAEAELRALREMADELGLDEKAKAPAAAPRAPQSTSLPQRLYLLLDGRGLDGRGMPIEVIDLPCTIGSDKRSTVWINSPQIETHHLRITHGDEGWVLDDLNSERGTFLGDKKIKRRVIKDGDEYRLAGYLRMRTELR